MSGILILFAKAPEAGVAKTRLIPVLSPSGAARLQEAMIIDILNATQSLPTDRCLMASPSAQHPFFQRMKSLYDIPCNDQVGADLGERLKNAFRLYFRKGYQRVVIIGTDAPTLPVSWIQQAFGVLDKEGLVLGPSTDGGYYLVGLGEEVGALFEGIPWGTERVLAETLKVVNQRKIPSFLLPFWYDLDRPGDLDFIYQHQEYLRKRGEPLPEETFRILHRYVNAASSKTHIKAPREDISV